MAESNAMIGYGGYFEVETAAGSGIYTRIAEVFSISPPSESTDVIDVTHMQSPDAIREFIQGLTDPGEVSLEMNFVPGALDGDVFIRAWRGSRERRISRIVFPNDYVWDFRCFVTGFEPTMPNEDKMTATLTAKVTSVVTGS